MHTEFSKTRLFSRVRATSGLLMGYGAAVLAACVIAIGLPPATASAKAMKDYRLSGPYTQNNLTVYLIHREGRGTGPTPVTLDEAMKEGLVKVIETGNVKQLMVRNLGAREVFIQAGDIVKGGKQDRVLVTSQIIPPHSGYLPIGAFCVESGRWAGRGREKVSEFSASAYRMPSRAGKIAILKRMGIETVHEADRIGMSGIRIGSGISQGARRRASGRSLQNEVWRSVGMVQDSLGMTVGARVTDRRSRTSLQLSLENKCLASALVDYEKALRSLLDAHPDAVGYVFAVGGRLNSGDEFGSPDLFRKVWPRQLRAAATEAIAETGVRKRKQPTLAEVAAFIDAARAAKSVSRAMPGGMNLETRMADEALYMEVRRGNNRWVHRTFVAR